jgi:hypothetical protein
MASETDKEKELRKRFLLLHAHFLLSCQTVHSLQAMTQLGLGHTHAAIGRHTTGFVALESPTKEQRTNYELIRDLLKIQIDSAQGAVDAAGIIYIHAILDAVIYRLCEISMSIDPNSWIPFIQEKKVSFSHLQQNNKVSTIQQTLLNTAS